MIPLTDPLATQRARAALRNQFVGDALAMPVHWYYNPLDIDRAFPGGVQRLEAAPAQHPSSIMVLHSTRHGGRGSQGGQREIVGDVILKGRRQFWGVPGMHYHQGMQAGENTLNAHCTRVLMRTLTTDGGLYQPEHFLRDYIAFMTAESPAHPDTYAESWHRGFFANLEGGRPPERCAAVTHDTPSVGGLVSIAALLLSLRLHGVSLEEAQAQCRTHLLLTHPDDALARVCDAYTALLRPSSHCCCAHRIPLPTLCLPPVRNAAWGWTCRHCCARAGATGMWWAACSPAPATSAIPGPRSSTWRTNTGMTPARACWPMPMSAATTCTVAPCWACFSGCCTDARRRGLHN